MKTALRLWMPLPGIALALGCASGPKPVAKVDDSGLSRLNEEQMQPVDDARVEEGRARDALAKANANLAEGKARAEVAKTERDVTEAQLKRSTAERDMLKKEFADRDAIARVENDIQASQDRIRAADLKRAYLETMVAVGDLDRQLVAQHVETAAAQTELAKFRAMRAANAPHAAEVNVGALEARLAESQRKEADIRKSSADHRTAAVDAYNRWQELDARVRTLARPEPVPTPPPAAGDQKR